MAKKRKKPSALQRRRQKEREREERKRYEAGKIPPQEPKSKAKRKRKEQERRKAEKEEHFRLHKSELDRMKKKELQFLAHDLFDKAYGKYRGLKQRGISNVGTSIYESDFAGQAGLIYRMNKNTLRAVIRDLRRWLDRKDLQTKRALKNQEKHLKKWGFKDADEAKKFWDDYRKWRQVSDEASNADGSPPGVDDFMTAWFNGMANGADEDQIFDDADSLVRSDYEADAPDPWDLPDPDDFNDDEEDEWEDEDFWNNL